MMSTLYGYTVQVRRLDTARWLPIACNTLPEADAVAEHAIVSGGYHIARVASRVGSSNMFVVSYTLDIRNRVVPAEDEG